MKTYSQLLAAQGSATLVRFWRRFETSPICGYVLDVGPRFFLLGLVSDRIWFDGFECFRVADVRKMKPEPRADFIETALRRRRDVLKRRPRITLQSVQEMVTSAGREFPLI